MNVGRIGSFLGFVAALLFAQNVFATFISTPEEFLLDVDFSLDVPRSGVATSRKATFDESQDGWEFIVEVVLVDDGAFGVNGDRLTLVGEVAHELGGVNTGVRSFINPPIRNGEAGDTQNLWPSLTTEFVVAHGGAEDIYEYLLSITSVDRTMPRQLLMTGSLTLTGRHVEPLDVTAPEPTTTALLALGLLGACYARRRHTH